MFSPLYFSKTRELRASAVSFWALYIVPTTALPLTTHTSQSSLPPSSFSASNPIFLLASSLNLSFFFFSQFAPTMAGESSVQASSPLEMKGLGPFDQKLAMAKRCGHEGVVAGARAAVVATVASVVPTLASVRMVPWARRNLNPTAQALIVSLVAGSAFFVVADKTVLTTARRNSFKNMQL